MRNSVSRAEAPESQLMRYCLDKEDKIRNYNSKLQARRLAEQRSLAEQESESDEDFENNPDLDQSFQTMREDDEEVESDDEDQNFFIQNAQVRQKAEEAKAFRFAFGTMQEVSRALR